jgi:hypothetical protein
VEPVLPTLPEHLSSPLVFSGVRVTRSLVLCVCFVDRCLSICTFSFGHCVICSSSIYIFWLPLWYLQTLPINSYHYINSTHNYTKIVVCPFVLFLLAIVLSVCSSSIYGIWLLLWYLLTSGHCVVCSSSIYGF